MTTEIDHDGPLVIALPKQKGKTSALLEWLLRAPEDEHRVIVSSSLEASYQLMRMASDLGLLSNPNPLKTWQFVSLDEITQSPRGLWSGVLLRGGRMVLGLDNVDLMLPQGLRRWEIGAMTITGSTTEEIGDT